MNFWKLTTVLTSLACCICCLPLLAQQKNMPDAQQFLEQRLLALEDYTKEQIHRLQKELESKERLIRELQEQNSAFAKDIAQLKNNLRLAESEILKLKIASSSQSKEPQASQSPVSPQDSVAQTQTTVSQEQPAYTDPQVKKWVQVLQTTDISIRMGAVLELSKLANAESTRALVAALEDKSNYVKLLVCKALARQKDPMAIPALFRLLQDTKLEIRTSANKTLESITGLRGEFNPSANQEERTKAIDLWKKKLDKTANSLEK